MVAKQIRTSEYLLYVEMAFGKRLYAGLLSTIWSWVVAFVRGANTNAKADGWSRRVKKGLAARADKTSRNMVHARTIKIGVMRCKKREREGRREQTRKRTRVETTHVCCLVERRKRAIINDKPEQMVKWAKANEVFVNVESKSNNK